MQQNLKIGGLFYQFSLPDKHGEVTKFPAANAHISAAMLAVRQVNHMSFVISMITQPIHLTSVNHYKCPALTCFLPERAPKPINTHTHTHTHTQSQTRASGFTTRTQVNDKEDGRWDDLLPNHQVSLCGSRLERSGRRSNE